MRNGICGSQLVDGGRPVMLVTLLFVHSVMNGRCLVPSDVGNKGGPLSVLKQCRGLSCVCIFLSPQTSMCVCMFVSTLDSMETSNIGAHVYT